MELLRDGGVRLEELGAAPVEARGLALGELAFPVCRVEALLGADLGHAGLHLGHDLDLVLDGGDLLLGGELGLAESEHFGWYLGVGCYGVKKEKGSVDGIAIWERQGELLWSNLLDGRQVDVGTPYIRSGDFHRAGNEMRT